MIPWGSFQPLPFCDFVILWLGGTVWYNVCYNSFAWHPVPVKTQKCMFTFISNYRLKYLKIWIAMDNGSSLTGYLLFFGLITSQNYQKWWSCKIETFKLSLNAEFLTIQTWLSTWKKNFTSLLITLGTSISLYVFAWTHSFQWALAQLWKPRHKLIRTRADLSSWSAPKHLWLSMTEWYSLTEHSATWKTHKAFFFFHRIILVRKDLWNHQVQS